MDLDLRQLMHIARRRWWIVVLLMIVAGASAYVSASRQEDQYAANAKILVISGKPDSGSDYSALQTSRSLAETYRQLIETGPVMDRVIALLDLPYTSPQLREKVSTSVVVDTQIVQVSVTDHDPDMAASLANAISSEFRSYITEQVDPRIGAQVEIADPALVPTAPFAPQPMRSLLLGTFVGALLGAGVVALLEFLDNTVKPDVNIQGIASAPVLASVAEVSRLAPGGSQVYTMAQPRTSASEAMRLLRTNLQFASASGKIDSLAITSSAPGEGKSTITANLGVVLAQSGLIVAIVDGDLRNPTQHKIFGVENSLGMTSLLTNPEAGWEAMAHKVALPGLFLVPSGPIPPNPPDLLSSETFEQIIDRIKADVDIVLIDTPPILHASDPLIVSRITDGVMLVCRSHKTRIEAFRQAVQSIHQGKLRIVGIVLNRVPRRNTETYYYYGEYYGPTVSAATSSAAPSTHSSEA